jgi:hypothetical protein
VEGLGHAAQLVETDHLRPVIGSRVMVLKTTSARTTAGARSLRWKAVSPARRRY